MMMGTDCGQRAINARTPLPLGDLSCTSTASAPARTYASARRNASSTLHPAMSASVRAITAKSRVRWAFLAASNLPTNSAIDASSCRPSMKLFVLGNRLSSMQTAAMPAASNSRTMRMTLLELP